MVIAAFKDCNVIRIVIYTTYRQLWYLIIASCFKDALLC